MTALSILIAAAVRLLLIALFLPFSALDKIFNFGGARAQAGELVGAATAPLFVFAGLFVEVVMSLGVLTGVADRAAAAVLALYCCLTALGWKQFWRPGDFSKPNGVARGLFWDFWKNLALAGGLLLITFGTSAETVKLFVDAPLSSTHPYRTAVAE